MSKNERGPTEHVIRHGHWCFDRQVGPPYEAEDGRRVFPLSEFDDSSFLVIEESSGLWFEQQVGGTACCHPNVEGVLIRLNRDVSSRLADITCKMACCGGELEPSLADHPIWDNFVKEGIDTYWVSNKYPTKVEFNPDLAEHGTECFIPVIATFEGEVRNGWLMLGGNCD